MKTMLGKLKVSGQKNGTITTIDGLMYYIRGDLYRIERRRGFLSFIRTIFVGERGFAVCFLLRFGQYFQNKKLYIRLFVYPIIKFFHLLVQAMYNCEIYPETIIGYGLFLPHCHGITISSRCVIGNNCTIYPGTIIGVQNGCYPVIGDNIFIGSNVHISGNVVIGDNSALGPNVVIVKSVLPYKTVVLDQANMKVMQRSTPRVQNMFY